MEKVDILMAIYNPNKEYFFKQLDSIKKQTYENIRLLVFDDCVEKRFDQKLIEEKMSKGRKVPVYFLPYEEKNLGYAKAFEKLVEASDAKYIAFSDQDDIWADDKIKLCVETIQQDKSLVVAHSKKNIDEKDNITKKGTSKVISKKRATWKTGDDIAKYQMFRDFVAGNCMLVDGEFARKNMPIGFFAPHDTWIVCCAAIEGKISRLPVVLTKYRRHGKNVSGVLQGVVDKQQYYESRVKPNHEIVKDLLRKYPDFKDRVEVWQFSEARMRRDIKSLWKLSYLSPEKAKFEILLALTPDFLFGIIKKVISKL